MNDPVQRNKRDEKSAPDTGVGFNLETLFGSGVIYAGIAGVEASPSPATREQLARPYYLQPEKSIEPILGRWGAAELSVVESNYQELRTLLAATSEPRLKSLEPLMDATPFLPYARGVFLGHRSMDSSHRIVQLPDQPSAALMSQLAASWGVAELPPPPADEGHYVLNTAGHSWDIKHMSTTGNKADNLVIAAHSRMFGVQPDRQIADLIIQISWTHELEHVRLLQQSPPILGEKGPVEAQLLFLEEKSNSTNDNKLLAAIEKNQTLATIALEKLRNG